MSEPSQSAILVARCKRNIGPITNYVATFVALATLCFSDWIALYAILSVNVALAVAMPMLERRQLTMFTGRMAGIDALVVAFAIGAMFAASIYQVRVQGGGMPNFLAHMASFLALPLILDMVAHLNRVATPRVAHG